MRTVPGDSDARPAISSIGAPSAASSRTSASRGVSGLSPAAIASAASSGSTCRPPACTVRTTSARVAAEVVFGRNPRTPADSARFRCPGRPWLVMITVATRGEVRVSSSATAIPSAPGICRSSTATSSSHLRRNGQRLVAGCGLRHHRQVVLEVEQLGERDPDEVLVIGEQHPDHAGSAGPRPGSVATTAKLDSEPVTVSPAPSGASRSRRPASPDPPVLPIADDTVVDDGQLRAGVPDRHRGRRRMSQHVGHRLSHHPGRGLVPAGGYVVQGELDADAGRLEQRPGPLELLGEVGRAVAAGQLARLSHRLVRHSAHLQHLRRSAGVGPVRQARGELGLDRDRR